MALRIRFVEPAPPGHNVYDLAQLPRLGLPLIATMLAEAGHDVRVYAEVLAQPDLDDCLGADLVGISSTTSTAPAAYRLADLLAEAGVPVVLGGPHVTFLADEALGHAPYVVRGEGEATMLDLVEHLEKGRGLEEVLGLSYRGADGEPFHNPARARCSQQEFERLPIPRLELLEGYERMVTKPLMTQWGCPFDCEFCSVTAMFSRAVRHRRAEQVLAELAGLDARRVFFYDDNFVVNKARTAALLSAMVDSSVTPEFFAQVRADSALRSLKSGEVDDEFLTLLQRAGCRMVMIGIEAVTDKALVEMGKRQSVETIERSIAAFHRHGIGVHGMFVAGFDADDAGTTEATVDFARRLEIDTFQLMIETPLPGTHLWSRIETERRLLSEDWSLFDGHHVVMQPAQMSPLELQLGVLEAMRHFYSWPRILASGLAAAVRHLPDLAHVGTPALLRRLPSLARAGWSRRFEDVAQLVQAALPAEVARRLSGAMWLPALRFYARRQLSAWWEQERSRDHLQLLQTLSR